MGALTGLAVLDLSFYAPGRWPTMVLGDLGADVICVEQPRTEDLAHPSLNSDSNSRWVTYQRNKRSITLNLKTETGKTIFEGLAKKADVVLESYKPGTARRLGVDYESVKALNPDVIYCSVSGFGQTGPYVNTAGHEPNYQGLSGALGYNRKGDDDVPMMINLLIGDYVGGGTNALVAILSALYHRGVTGKGQHIDVAIANGILPFMGVVPYAKWTNDPYRQIQNSSGRRPAFRAYRTKDDKFVAISPGDPVTWRTFCDDIGHPEMYDEAGVIGEHRDEIVKIFEQTFLTKTQAEWMAINDRDNVCITPVLTTIEDIENDPQMIHREAIVEIDYEPLGRIKQIAPPFKMSETPPSVRWMPRYGEHTAEVYAELGFHDIDALRAEGVCE
jgi:crotonobetainyl-CoA:carnitine CoA-transferase CaiB-like acyl-CoA transferase